MKSVKQLLLYSSDINVVNRTTLSLWHFQQMARHLLPFEPGGDTNAGEPEDDHDDSISDAADRPDSKHAPNKRKRAMELGEGMGIAAVLYEENEHIVTDDENSDDTDSEDDSVEETHEDADVSVKQTTGMIADSNTVVQAVLTPLSQVSVIYKRYRCAICLDASPSTLSIDPMSGRLFLDLLYESVELFIWSLLRPMEVDNQPFTPEIHVTVLVQGAHVDSLCVLLQGYVVKASNAAGFLQIVRERMQLIEDDWAEKAQSDGYVESTANSQQTRASLSWIIQNAVFALNSLPSNGAPILAFVTDGVVDLFDAYSYDNLLMQLIRHDIQCHFLRTGGSGEEPNASFGFVPDIDLLRFIADSSGGSVFDYVALHDALNGSASEQDAVKHMTGLQEACFIRKSSVYAVSTPILKLDEICCTSFDGRTLLPLRPYRMWREKVHEYRIFADVDRIIEARIREGFIINKVHVKTYYKPASEANLKRITDAAHNSEDGADVASTREVTKILIVFLLQWKQNVWIEYVVSATLENASSGTTAAIRRSSIQGGKTGTGVTNFTQKAMNLSLSKDHARARNWNEWYVKMNIIAYSEFLREFGDCMQSSSSANGASRSGFSAYKSGSPVFLHEFIRNVQDVDRVLLHLMTATVVASSAASSTNQYSFNTSGNASSSSTVVSSHQNSHPVFNIIGELSPVLWHRWFYVERFEMVCVVKNDIFTEFFYRHEENGTIDRGHSIQRMRAMNMPNPSRRFVNSLGGNTYGISIGVKQISERLGSTLLKWSSQKLSSDLFLKFLTPHSTDGSSLRLKNTAVSASSTTPTTRRRRQRPSPDNSTADGFENSNSTTGKTRSSLCFVRLEIKNKTLCAIHVAFFATGPAARKQTLIELKNAIAAGLNDLSPNASSSSQSKSIVLCHRMISRLLVTHATLVLCEGGPGVSSHEHLNPPIAHQVVSSCCGGSELQLRNVFGAYMWHSSWKWKISNPNALLRAMRQIHEARIQSGFWVLDWKVHDDDDGQNPRIESVIFGREILMEDENGHVKASLVQYALHRLSEACLMTSLWMEPQHGVVRTRMSDRVDKSDKFHWGLRHAIGHDAPFDEVDATLNRGTQNVNGTADAQNSTANFTEEADFEWHGSTYLGENDLLQLIRQYIFKRDRHYLSCLYTLDAIMNMRESIEPQSQLSKDVEDVVGASWRMDNQAAAAKDLLLPPFSTTRLLGASKRSTEHFLMYLENKTGNTAETIARLDKPTVSPANEHLYSMLERTLRGLSDCEVAWTDFNGDEVGAKTNDGYDSDSHLLDQGTMGQMPLWLKNRLSLSFQKKNAHPTLSRGKCFAKLLSNGNVVLAFLPSLDSLQLKSKMIGNSINSTATSSIHLPEKLKWLDGAAPAAQEDSGMTQLSTSADDIVLYQERRLSFREGYKSWRMGHYHGSKDAKSAYDQNSRKLRRFSTPEAHKFCEEVSQEATYGADFHLLIERDDGVLGSGFFQVAFYECSISRLSDVYDLQKEKQHLDLPQAIIRRLFFPSTMPKLHTERGSSVVGKENVKKSLASSSAKPTGVASNVTMSKSDSDTIAYRQFRKKVKRAHEHNFSRGVYIALREGGNLQQSDLMQALSSCIEVPIDVDITLLYRMLQATTGFYPTRGSSAVLKEKLYKSFETILSTTFVPIAGTKYYYFNGNENITYDDTSEGELDLHFLVDDRDGAESSAAGTETESGRLILNDMDEDDNGSLDDISIDELASSSNDSIEKSTISTVPSIQGNAASMDPKENSKTSRTTRRAARRRPPPVMISSTEFRVLEQHASTDEDAEFNKDVAVATSSFSSPFFFRFECRELASPRSLRDTRLEIHQQNAISTSIAYPMDAQNELSGSEATPGVQHRSQKESSEASSASFLAGVGVEHGDISQIAEWFGNTPSCRVALRLVTLTLPNEKLFEGSLQQQHQMPFDMEEGDQWKGMRPTRAQILSSLPLFQRQILKRARKDIKEWCSVEILAILRKGHKITPSIGQLVQRLFEDLPAHSVTVAKYPLDFVSSSEDASIDPLSIFRRELETGGPLFVHECNSVYFVINRKESGHDISVERENLSTADSTFEIPFWAYFVIERDCVNLYLHHPDRLTTKSQTFDRLAVLTRLQLGVMAVCKRVNQFLLLLQLHETRTANSYLIPGDVNQVSSPVSQKRKDSAIDLQETDHRKFFWPGQFECDLKYSAVFKLHERLAPNIALNMLCTSALEQFQVHNRRYTFVYRDRGGHVYYMKISIQHDNSTGATEDKRDRPRSSRMHSAAIPVAMTNSTNSSVVNGGAGILLEVFGVCEAGEEVTHELCRLLERKLDEATQLILMKLLARNAKFQLSPTDMTFVYAGSPAETVDYVLPLQVIDGSVLIHYMCQTLSLVPYIRHLTNPGLSKVQRDNRSDSSATHDKAANNDLPDVAAGPELQLNGRTDSMRHLTDSTLVHPAYGFSNTILLDEHKEELTDSNRISPVFFSVPSKDMTVEPKNVSILPEIVDQASYVLNLNPELRLSPGFLSKVGRGLAVLHVDIVQNLMVEGDTYANDGTRVKYLKDFMDIDSTANALLKSSSRPHLTLRCKLWIRGSINIQELQRALESCLQEVLSDFCIETIIRERLTSQSKDHMEQETKGKQIGLPASVQTLATLLEKFYDISSSSLTKISHPVSIASWDVGNIVAQLQKILMCIPSHLRPVIYSKKDADSEYELLPLSDQLGCWNEHSHQYFRLVPRLRQDPLDPLCAVNVDNVRALKSSIPVVHSDPVLLDQSDTSSQSGVSHLHLGSTTGSESNLSASCYQVPSSSFHAPAHHPTKEFVESELLLFQNSATGGVSAVTNADGKSTGTDKSLPSRSFYYVIDISSTAGMQMYGYNMSSAFVDWILVHTARIITWSSLREMVLRSLLLEKSGISQSAPTGSAVIHPRDLYRNTGGALIGKSSFSIPKDFCVQYIEFWKPVMEILSDHFVIPKVLDSSQLQLIDASSLGKFLREAHTLPSDSADIHRPRSRSTASLQGVASTSAASPMLHREASSQSSSWSIHSEAGASRSTKPIATRESSLSMKKSDRTVPSPTKRVNPIVPFGGGNSSNVLPARLRGNAGATTALLAARARARGGLPGRPGTGPLPRPAVGTDGVAPWDLPLTNTKGPVLNTSGDSANVTNSTNGIALARDSNNTGNSIAPTHAARNVPPHGSSSTSDHQQMPSSIISDPGKFVGTAWKNQVKCVWGPRFTFSDSFDRKKDPKKPFVTLKSSNRLGVKSEQDMLKNPLQYYTHAFQTRWQQYETQSTSHTICVNLFEKLVMMKPQEKMDEPVSRNIIDRLVESGHLLLHQRFRITFVERWEVMKVEEEFVEEGMKSGRLRALQASMDLVNLLSYKKEVVFAGNDVAIANLYTERTVLGMCATEGGAIREMKMQIMKNIFHLRMEVAHAFYEQCAIHLQSIGFQHLVTVTNHTVEMLSRSSSLLGVSSVDDRKPVTAMDVTAADSEGFSEYFFYSVRSNDKAKGWMSDEPDPPSLLLLELKCDHQGVRLGVILVSERDLLQQNLGFQNSLVPCRVGPKAKKNQDLVVTGAMINMVSRWVKENMYTSTMIYGFTIRFFQKYLLKWYFEYRAKDSQAPSSSPPQRTKDANSFQNIVKGLRCFLRAFPNPPPPVEFSKRAKKGIAQQLGESILRTAVVELPPTHLHSNCSESILLKILLRYIACHGTRYEVLDLMQFGTPDAVVCHSESGSFFHRSTSANTIRRDQVMAPEDYPGYSLLITSQSIEVDFGLLSHEKKRRRNCIQLILLKSSPMSFGVGNGVLPEDRALGEAELFVQELFRVAAEHYERDLLWSRLLYDDTTGPGAQVAAKLALPVDHFKVEVGPQQFEECLRLSVCTPLEEIDPRLEEIMNVEGVFWQEFALRLRDLYADQVKEYQFEGEDACHFLLLCPNTHDLIIHLRFDTSGNEIDVPATSNGREVKIEICRREEPANKTFTAAQRRVITDFVNSIVHWQWRSLIYD